MTMILQRLRLPARLSPSSRCIGRRVAHFDDHGLGHTGNFAAARWILAGLRLCYSVTSWPGGNISRVHWLIGLGLAGIMGEFHAAPLNDKTAGRQSGIDRPLAGGSVVPAAGHPPGSGKS
ncbi:MAG: hypothetical protein H6976_04135 [Gammaproteobacteria bacterium]|nr:hypothetical protein [Gammaproteobacteria bacterium]